MADTVTRPRHLSDCRPMLSTVHPRRIRLDIRPHLTQIERPPPTASFTLVEARSLVATKSATPLLRPPRPHMSDNRVALLIELDRLDNSAIVDTKHLTPYPHWQHPVLLPRNRIALTARKRRQDTPQARNLDTSSQARYHDSVEIADSARKHGIGDDDIRAAIRNAIVQTTIATDRDLVIGADANGRLLEIVLLDPDADLTVIHAMPLRPKFYRLLRGR